MSIHLLAAGIWCLTNTRGPKEICRGLFSYGVRRRADRSYLQIPHGAYPSLISTRRDIRCQSYSACDQAERGFESNPMCTTSLRSSKHPGVDQVKSSQCCSCESKYVKTVWWHNWLTSPQLFLCKTCLMTPAKNLLLLATLWDCSQPIRDWQIQSSDSMLSTNCNHEKIHFWSIGCRTQNCTESSSCYRRILVEHCIHGCIDVKLPTVGRCAVCNPAEMLSITCPAPL